MSVPNPSIADIVRRDGRFSYEAYEFVYHALNYTQRALGRAPRDADDEEACHVSGRELCEGIRDYALREYGLMARTVFRLWGVRRTDDFGAIVFNLIGANLMRGTPEDSLDDFRDVYDFDDALVRGYQFTAGADG